MPLVSNEEQLLLETTIKDLLQKHSSVDSMRELRDSPNDLGYSLQLWQQFVDLGVPAMAMPERFGGHGFGYAGLGAVMKAAGRNLAASPLLATVALGASALELAGTEQQREELLPLIASGSLTVAFALDEHRHHQPTAVSASLLDRGDEMVLNGSKVFVLDGHSADKLLVVARSSGNAGDEHGLSFALIDRVADGVKVQRRILMDGRNSATVHFDQVKVTPDMLLGTPGEAWPTLQQILDRGTICMAAEMLGGALAVFEQTMVYIKEREQFGVKIGSFQALQHRSALMFCQLQKCESVVLKALSCIDQDSDDIALHASLAKATANKCFQHVCNEAIQMHGGMGITDDVNVGLYLKRAKVALQTLGDTGYHHERYARLMGY